MFEEKLDEARVLVSKASEALEEMERLSGAADKAAAAQVCPDTASGTRGGEMSTGKMSLFLTCPFCGQHPWIDEIAKGHWRLECDPEGDCTGNVLLEAESRDALAAAWNRRAGQ